MSDLCQSWLGGLIASGHLTYRYMRDGDGVVCE